MTCHANHDALVPVSQSHFQTSADEVQKVRSILRFCLGALNDYKAAEVPYGSLTLIDRFLLHLLVEFDVQVKIIG